MLALLETWIDEPEAFAPVEPLNERLQSKPKDKLWRSSTASSGASRLESIAEFDLSSQVDETAFEVRRGDPYDYSDAHARGLGTWTRFSNGGASTSRMKRGKPSSGSFKPSRRQCAGSSMRSTTTNYTASPPPATSSNRAISQNRGWIPPCFE